MGYASKDIRNILVAGHAGCGKTTLTEALLYMSGASERMGRVEDGTTASDFDPEEIRRKFRRAVTDSDGEIRVDRENKPGVTNLLDILSAVTGEGAQQIADRLAGKGYGALKDEVAEAVIAELAPVQARYSEILADKAYLEGVMQSGAERASRIAAKTMRKVHKKLGLAPYKL